MKHLIPVASLIAVILAPPRSAVYALQGSTAVAASTTSRYLETPAGRKPRVVITVDP